MFLKEWAQRGGLSRLRLGSLTLVFRFSVYLFTSNPKNIRILLISLVRRYNLSFIFLFLTVDRLHAQNLVSSPDLEYYISCPTGYTTPTVIPPCLLSNWAPGQQRIISISAHQRVTTLMYPPTM